MNPNSRAVLKTAFAPVAGRNPAQCRVLGRIEALSTAWMAACGHVQQISQRQRMTKGVIACPTDHEAPCVLCRGPGKYADVRRAPAPRGGPKNKGGGPSWSRRLVFSC